MRQLLIAFSLSLASCAASELQPAPTVDSIEAPKAWTFEDHASALRTASCPEGVAFTRPEQISVEVKPIGHGPEHAQDANITGMSLVGAWQLRSDESNFGGLSGLEVMRSGSLLAITDSGAFVWLGIDPDTGAPDGFGSIAYMRNAEGNHFPSKRSADSEGLFLRDGLALVSFEQDHRIEAFDLEGCGSSARAARVADLSPVQNGKRLPDNRGAEALAYGDGLWVGFEDRHDGQAFTGTVMTDGSLIGDMIDLPSRDHALTGTDIADEMSARLYRAFDPIRGARVVLEVQHLTDLIGRAELKAPLPVDNFEGVAIGVSPEGKRRIWIISDDNFNRLQRTLLLAFDLDN